MKYREKLGYIVLGGVLMLVGMLAAGLFSPLGAQSRSKGNFDVITCRVLRVVNSDGKGQVTLSTFENNAFVSVHDKDGEVMVMMSATEEYGGDIRVFGKNKKAEARMDTTEKGGRFRVIGKDGKSEASMRLNELGGEVAVCGKDGRTGAVAIMGITPFFGGTILVTNEDGKKNGLMVE